MSTASTLGNSGGIGTRVKSYKASKSVVVWSCLACVAGTIAIGFTWGGWVTGRTARDLADRAAIGGQAKLAASICVDRFVTGPDARAQTALLASAETWRQGDFIVQGGWLALPGRTEPVPGAADLCVQQILSSSRP